jgi:hypothetical protein
VTKNSQSTTPLCDNCVPPAVKPTSTFQNEVYVIERILLKLIDWHCAVRPPGEAGGDLLEIIKDLQIKDSDKLIKAARQILNLKAYKFSNIGLYAENKIQIKEGGDTWDMKNVAYAALVCVSVHICTY